MKSYPNSSQCLEEIFIWLSEFLGKIPKEQFMPHEWKIRTHAAELQLKATSDCAQLTVTHAIYLAFVGISIIYVPFLHSCSLSNFDVRFGRATASYSTETLLSQTTTAKWTVANSACHKNYYRKNSLPYDSESPNQNKQYWPLIDSPPTQDDGFELLYPQSLHPCLYMYKIEGHLTWNVWVFTDCWSIV